MFKKLAIMIFIIVGSFTLITQQDYTEEMNELQNKLNENAKILEEKSKESKENKQTTEKKEELNIVIEKDDSKEEKQVEENEQTKETKEVSEVKEEKKIVNPENLEEEIRQLPVVGIGDSVLLGAIDELYERFPNGHFDGKVSRTITAARDVIQALEDEGRLSNILILALANNGDYSDRINERFMELIGDREVYWVNAVGADDPEFNDRFREFAKNYPNIHIVEWDKAAEGHPEYFYADGIHTKGDGLTAYVDTIYNAIYNEYLKKYQ